MKVTSSDQKPLFPSSPNLINKQKKEKYQKEERKYVKKKKKYHVHPEIANNINHGTGRRSTIKDKIQTDHGNGRRSE